jgi:glycosyltransferase involved in cell wall biosynthesis
VEEAFGDGLAERLRHRIDLLYSDTSRRARVSRLRRHLSYMALAAGAVWRGRRYSGIVFWQQFIGLYWGMISRALGLRGAAGVVLTFIYRQRRGAFGRLQKAILGWALNAESLRSVVCHSSAEIRPYGAAFPAAGHKLVFLPYGVGARKEGVGRGEEQGQGGTVVGEYRGRAYLFSGGTSNRDFRTLAAAAARLDVPVVVACPKEVAGAIEWPRNVEVRVQAYGEAFEELLRWASCVVIPLRDAEVSAGQIVLLKAMREGRPIIVTEGAGTMDYVDEQCAWMVQPGSADEMERAMRRMLADPEESRRRGAEGRRRYEAEFTAARFGGRVADLMKE